MCLILINILRLHDFPYLLHRVQFASTDEFDIVAEVPLPVAIGNTRNFALFVSVNKRVVLVKLELVVRASQDLLQIVT